MPLFHFRILVAFTLPVAFLTDQLSSNARRTCNGVIMTYYFGNNIKNLKICGIYVIPMGIHLNTIMSRKCVEGHLLCKGIL